MTKLRIVAGPYEFEAHAEEKAPTTLARFVALPPSPLEQREKLEQLRALEAGMRIDATIVESMPLGVDTPADLERAHKILGRGKERRNTQL